MTKKEHAKRCEEQMAEFLRLLDELLLQRKSYQSALNAAENSEESKFAANSKLLRALRKEIWDARNRLPPHDANRKELKKLTGRIDSALAGAEIQLQADISEAKERELHIDFAAAKTNRERRRLGRLIAQQNRDRGVVSKHRTTATPEYEIARRKKQGYKTKKVRRVYNKICKTA
jgi:hypothetical protein